MDVDTRNAVVAEIKEGCALRTVLTKKPCPYFGPSESCADCTFEWVPIAISVGKLAKARRASYEKEAEKRKALEQELEQYRELMPALAAGGRALLKVMKIVGKDATEKEESDGGREPDKGEASSKRG